MSTFVLFMECVLFMIALVGMSIFLTFGACFLVSVVVVIIEAIHKALKKGAK